jgi:hypothetical protein
MICPAPTARRRTSTAPSRGSGRGKSVGTSRRTEPNCSAGWRTRAWPAGLAALVLGAPALLGLALAFTTWAMANHDLDRMGSDRLDPRGRAETSAACERAGHAIALGLMAPLACLILWCGCVRLLGKFL